MSIRKQAMVTKRKRSSDGTKVTSVKKRREGKSKDCSEREAKQSTVESDAGCKEFGSRSLSRFREIELESLIPLVRSFVSAQNLKQNADPTLDGTLLEDAEDGLSQEERIELVDQALVLLEQNYVHRPLKEALYAINPVQKLKLLREELVKSFDSSSFEGDLDFHRKLLQVFLSTRDLHTNYLLPSPFRETTAFLPFLVEDYFDPSDSPNQRRFMVTRVTDGIADSEFVPGVEITRWNGVPIERAVEINGERFAGSNLEANRARGLETLTVRPFLQSLPPEEDFILVEFKAEDGSQEEIRFEWRVLSPDTADMAAFQQLDELTESAQGIDLEQAMVRLAKRVLFAGELSLTSESPASTEVVSSNLPRKILEAKSIEVDSRKYGYLRIRSFSVGNADQFVGEIVRLVELLPQDGLIIDVRGNGGGLILAGEQLLQIFTPRTVSPTLFQMLVTPLNRRLVEELGFLNEWKKSMRKAVQTGAVFSQGYPITPVDKVNEIGQRYFGPVVLVTDALCYSTTDIFAAGFQDHEIGTIIGVDNNTGAGGANVWTHDLLTRFLQNNSGSPYTPLPSNSGMRVSIRRTIRVGESNGTILEDFGVAPDILHPMTQDDLMHSNRDLIARAVKVLDEKKIRHLHAEITDEQNSEIVLKLTTEGLDRVDIFDGLRPVGSIELDDGVTEVTIQGSATTELRLLGYEQEELVASRLV